MKTNLTTKYLGLTLQNPFIVSSSGLTSNIEKVRAAAAAGAGAVVLKSIFQEQITQQAQSLEQYSDYPEAADYLRTYVASGAMSEYLELIRQASSELTIPIIA
ncbi:MAG: diguanylate cyclase, partial [Mucinivorans sp.]